MISLDADGLKARPVVNIMFLFPCKILWTLRIAQPMRLNALMEDKVLTLPERKNTNMTGQEILSQRFPKQVWGYRPETVDACMLMIAQEVDDLNSEIHRLADNCAELETKNKNVQELESLLTRTLQATTAMHENAKFEAETLIERSKVAAEENLERAESLSERLRSDAAEDVQRMREGLSSLENTQERSIITLLETLNRQFRLLEQEAKRLGLKIPQLRATKDEKIVRPVQMTARS